MHSKKSKLYEVERIAGRRNAAGKEEFLVHWKGYKSTEATWEPSENLTFCEEVVKSFVSRIAPIPGGIPCNISEFINNKKKTVHVKQILLNKRGRPRKNKELSKKEISLFKKMVGRKSKKSMSETERLIRDTLVHESKSMSHVNQHMVVNGLLDMSKPESHNHTNLRHSRVNGLLKDHNGNTKKRKLDEGAEYASDSCHRMERRQSYHTNGTSIMAPISNNWNLKHPLRDAGEGDHIICHRTDDYMKIVLNNTARHNVLTTNMMETITQCLQTAEGDNSVHAVLLRNNGDHFCSGIDYSEIIDCTDEHEIKSKASDICRAIRSLTEALIHFPKPILTAANGVCLEYGVALVALSDLTFTSSKTRFQLTFSELNLTPIGCLSYLLPKLVGPAMANAMIFLGEDYRATAAYDRGLINDIYGVHSFDEDIDRRIRQLASGQIQVMEGTKRMMRDYDLETVQRACDREMKVFKRNIRSESCHKKLTENWSVSINLYGTA